MQHLERQIVWLTVSGLMLKMLNTESGLSYFNSCLETLPPKWEVLVCRARSLILTTPNSKAPLRKNCEVA